MALIRSIIHMLWMAITVVPYTWPSCWVRCSGCAASLYRIARAWLSLCAQRSPAAGHQYRVTGMEHLPPGREKRCGAGASTSPRTRRFDAGHHAAPLAYVFKKSCCTCRSLAGHRAAGHDPHRPQPARQGVQQGGAAGQGAAGQGHLGHHVPRRHACGAGQKGQYKSGGTRLAIDTGVPVIPIAVTSAKVWPARPSSKSRAWWMCPSAPPLPQLRPPARRADARGEAWIEAEMRRLDPEAYPAEPQPWPRPNRMAAPTELASRNPAMRQHCNATRWCPPLTAPAHGVARAWRLAACDEAPGAVGPGFLTPRQGAWQLAQPPAASPANQRSGSQPACLALGFEAKSACKAHPQSATSS